MQPKQAGMPLTAGTSLHELSNHVQVAQGCAIWPAPTTTKSF